MGTIQVDRRLECDCSCITYGVALRLRDDGEVRQVVVQCTHCSKLTTIPFPASPPTAGGGPGAPTPETAEENSA